jgi:hypothetical protein
MSFCDKGPCYSIQDGDGALCSFDIPEASAIDFFGLEGLHEAFGFGIVVGIAGGKRRCEDRRFLSQAKVMF